VKIAVLAPCSVKGLATGLPEFCDLDHPSQLIRSLVDGYLDRGHSVEVIKFNRFTPESVRSSGPRVGVTLIPRRDRAIQLTPTLWRKERMEAIRWIEKLAPDVVHAHWTYEYAIAAIGARIPSVVTAHDVPSRLLGLMRPRYYWWPRLLQGYYVSRIAPRMTAQSPYTLNCWRKEMGRKKPIDLVPNPIAADVLAIGSSIRPPNASPAFAACAAGFHPRKNMKNLFEAFSLLKTTAPAATLKVFGDDFGPRQVASDWAKKHALSEGVEFRGNTDRLCMLREIFAECSAFVHPALEESFGMVVAEAMAMGIPVVGGKASGAVPWLLDDGKAGILCDVTSPDEIRLAMLRALTEQEFGQIGRTRILQEFQVPGIVGSYLKILDQERSKQAEP
jgi:glycosyltransferase involved in cell wall biosynthesis